MYFRPLCAVADIQPWLHVFCFVQFIVGVRLEQPKQSLALRMQRNLDFASTESSCRPKPGANNRAWMRKYLPAAGLKQIKRVKTNVAYLDWMTKIAVTDDLVDRPHNSSHK